MTDQGMTRDQRQRRIEDLRAKLRRGCAGPRKFAQRTMAGWMEELRRLEKEQE